MSVSALAPYGNVPLTMDTSLTQTVRANGVTVPVHRLLAWYDADDPSGLFSDAARTTPTTANGPVGSISDRSMFRMHLNRFGADSRRGIRIENAQNGRRVVRLDGIDDGYVSADHRQAACPDAHLFLVARLPATWNWRYLGGLGMILNGTNEQFGLMYAIPVGNLKLAGIGDITGQNALAGTWCLLEAVSDTGELLVNGVSVGTLRGNTRLSFGNFEYPVSMGTKQDGSIPSAMDFGEMILFGRRLSASEAAGIRADLKTKWGTP